MSSGHCSKASYIFPLTDQKQFLQLCDSRAGIVKRGMDKSDHSKTKATKMQQRISVRLHHGLDVKNISTEVFRPSPWWRKEDHITTESGCQLKEIPLDKFYFVSNIINSGIVLRQVQPFCIYINCQHCKKGQKYCVCLYIP